VGTTGGDPGVTVDTEELGACPMPCIDTFILVVEFPDEVGRPEDESSNEDVVGWLAYEAGETESCVRKRLRVPVGIRKRR
jgi:hypothetical protein